MRSSRSLFLVPSFLLALALVGCAEDIKGDCTEVVGTGLFPELGVKESCLDSGTSDDTGITDSGDSVPDSDTDSGAETGDSDSAETGETGETGDSDTDTAVDPIDADNDGFAVADDCDDGNAAINPDATEICDGVDNNCDDVIDTDATDQATFYADTDSDGYGDATVTVDDCSAPAGYVEDGTDCDDADATIHPYADEDCSAAEDLNCDGSFGYADADGDLVPACEDCDDTNAAAYPGNTETCDGVDNDCEGTVDEDATDELTWYADSDGDSYGDSDSTTTSCEEPTGYVADSTDCDDTAATAYPGGTEECDELNVDENCDGTAEADDSIGATLWKADDDGDGFGDPSVTVSQCDAPPGYVTTASGDEDCDDSDPAVNVDATEACNGYDDDCDGDIDESGSTGETTWYADSDEDGYGDLSTTALACDQPSKYSSDSSDCDDTDSGINPDEVDIASDGIDQDCDGADALETDSDGDGDPDSTDCDATDPGVYTGAVEYCDGVDEDCDGVIDDGAVDILTWYRDADNDGYGNVAVTVSSCSEPSGYTANATDCDDTSNDIYPGNIEWCDGTDNDCTGAADDGDYDADGYEVCDDCDDGDAGLNPGEPEACDGEDNDCDGVVDDGMTTEYFADSDGDGFGDPDVSEDACSASSGYVEDDTDCDDGDAGVNPGEIEVEANGVDDDCDGTELVFTTDFGASTGVCMLDGFVTSSGAAVRYGGGCYLWVEGGGSLAAPSVSDDIDVTGLTPGDTYTFSWEVGNAFSTSTTFVTAIDGGSIESLSLGTGDSGTLEIDVTVGSTAATGSVWITESGLYDGYLTGFTVTR